MSRLAELICPSPVIMAIVVAFLLAVAEYGMYWHLPIWVLPVLYMFWITPNYFLEIVEHRALGNSSWPVFSLETLVAGRNQTGVVFSVLVLVLAGILVLLFYAGYDAIAWLLLVDFMLTFPAIVALLAVTREFSVALNPGKALAAALGMGAGYWLCLISVALVLAIALIAEAQRVFYWYPLVFYALFWSAWITGSVVYTRRRSLGVHAPKSPEALAERARGELEVVRRGILNHAYSFATRGNRRGALQHIEGYIASDEDTTEARLWMLNEMMRWEDKAAPLEFANRLIEYCRQHDLEAEAAHVQLRIDHLQDRSGV